MIINTLSNIYKYFYNFFFNKEQIVKFEKPRGYKNTASHEICF